MDAFRAFAIRCTRWRFDGSRVFPQWKSAGSHTAKTRSRQDALLVALAFFNIGVEIGQVAIVAIVVPLLLVVDRLTARAPAAPARRPALVHVASALIAGLGGYWFIERTLLA